MAPDIAKEVGRLAVHRMSGLRGLQGIAAEPPPPRAVVLGHRWDVSCTELRRFLEEQEQAYVLRVAANVQIELMAAMKLMR